MKIDLLPPYSTIWVKGYLVVNPENRRNVILYNCSDIRSTVSYARYLMSVHLGRFLTDEEQVDHINNDKTDDRIENLQILSRLENMRKTHKKGETMRAFICPICSKEFYLTARQSHKINPSCSRKCGRIKAGITAANR